MTQRKTDSVRNPYRLSVEQFLAFDGRTLDEILDPGKGVHAAATAFSFGGIARPAQPRQQLVFDNPEHNLLGKKS